MRKLFFLIFIPISILISCSKKEIIINKSLAKNITSFSFDSLNPVIKASIDSNQNIITINFPAGLDIKRLSPTIVVSDKATVSPNSGVPQDFTQTVSFTVTAEDGSSKTYKVQINFDKSSAKNILSFSFNSNSMTVNTTIDSINRTIKATLTKGTDITKLSPIIVISEKASISPSSGEVIDFSKPIIYKITAEDGSVQTYTASIEVEKILTNSNSTVYVAGGNNVFYAIDATDGNEKWRYAVNDSIISSPIFSNGLILFGAGSYNGKNKNFFALDAKTGEIKWIFKLDQTLYSSPIIFNNIVYFGSNGKFYALDVFSGQAKWISNTDSVGSIGVASIRNNNIYFSSSFSLYSLNLLNGKENWKVNINANPSSPLITNNLLYVGVQDYYKNNLTKIKAYDLLSGMEKWSIDVTDVNFTTLTVENGSLFFTDKQFLLQLDGITGELKQKIRLSTSNESYKSLQIIDNIVYIVSDNKLFAFDMQSKITTWEFKNVINYISHLSTIANDAIYFHTVVESITNGVNTATQNLITVDRKSGVLKWNFKFSEKGPWSWGSPCVVMSNGEVYRGLGNIQP